MKIKLMMDVKQGEVNLVKDSIVDCDDATAKTMIDAKQAELYVEAVEQKEIKEKVEEVMSKEAKDTEVKGTVEVIKDAPLWKGMGEFLGAVVKAGRDGRVDERLMKSTGQSETASDGGYTVSTDIARYITAQASAA